MPLQGKKLPEAATYGSIQNQKGLTRMVLKAGIQGVFSPLDSRLRGNDS